MIRTERQPLETASPLYIADSAVPTELLPQEIILKKKHRVGRKFTMEENYSWFSDTEEEAASVSGMLLEEIRNLFYSYFDHPWLLNVIDSLSRDFSNFSSIRALLELRSMYPMQENIVLSGLADLKALIRTINIWLIPESTVFLGISPISTKFKVYDKAVRKCVAYTLPSNTRNLAHLIKELEKAILKESLLYC